MLLQLLFISKNQFHQKANMWLLNSKTNHVFRIDLQWVKSQFGFRYSLQDKMIHGVNSSKIENSIIRNIYSKGAKRHYNKEDMHKCY
jgi:hypothetical protein